VVVFCIDVSKDNRPQTTDLRPKTEDSDLWAEEINLWSLVSDPESVEVIPVATKCDLLSEKDLAKRLVRLNEFSGMEFIATSAENGAGIERLREKIDTILNSKSQISDFRFGSMAPSENAQDSIGLTTRHRQAVTEAIDNISEAVNELKERGSEAGEVVAMLLRAAYQNISNIEQPQVVGEQILEEIFQRFCIGK